MDSLNTLWRAFLVTETGLDETYSLNDLEIAYWNSLSGGSETSLIDAKRLGLDAAGFPFETYGSVTDQEKAFWNSFVPNESLMTAWYKSISEDLVTGAFIVSDDATLGSDLILYHSYNTSGYDLTDNGRISEFSGAVITGGKQSNALTLDGINDCTLIADHDSLSFGDASTDSAFSISAICYMNNATTFRIMTKLNDFTAGTIEYTFATDSGDKLIALLFDNTSTNRISVESNTNLTAYEGQWIQVGMSYDGSGTVAGIKLYLNGQALATTNTSQGTYVAMHNTATPVRIGCTDVSGTGFDLYANGKIDELAVWSKELSAANFLTLYNDGKFYKYSNSAEPEHIVGSDFNLLIGSGGELLVIP